MLSSSKNNFTGYVMHFLNYVYDLVRRFLGISILSHGCSGRHAQDSSMEIVESFYMRELPSTSICLSSEEGQRKLDEARANGMAEGFFDIISYIEPQKELAYCGIASLVTVLNTLRVDPGVLWKGPFRWYDETMLIQQETLKRVMTEGLTLEELVAYVPTDKVKCETHFGCDTSLDEFRQRVRDTCSSSTRWLICTYGRVILDQTGDGHYSPIIAYHESTDSILILDVARYKYPPHWVSCSLMWEAINTKDEVSQKSRGFLLISASTEENN